jgi:hypothetical protein
MSSRYLFGTSSCNHGMHEEITKSMFQKHWCNFLCNVGMSHIRQGIHQNLSRWVYLCICCIYAYGCSLCVWMSKNIMHVLYSTNLRYFYLIVLHLVRQWRVWKLYVRSRGQKEYAIVDRYVWKKLFWYKLLKWCLLRILLVCGVALVKLAGHFSRLEGLLSLMTSQTLLGVHA